MDPFPAADEPDLAELYHENTKYHAHLRSLDPAAFASDDAFPPARSLELRHADERIELPPPALGHAQLDETIVNRRSTRAFRQVNIALTELSRILHLTYGATGTEGGEALRASPSAGARYPLEFFVLVRRVDGIGAGSYHYYPESHSLEPLALGAPELDQVFMDQPWLNDAACVLVVAAVLPRTMVKYKARGYRLVLLDAGHAMQNSQLAATSAGLGACAVGGFVDDELAALLELDGLDEVALAAIAIGHR